MIGSNIIRIESTISTSDEAKGQAAVLPEGTVIIAEEQTGGRGKPGSSWFSPRGTGLYFSVILKPYKNSGELPRFTKFAAEAVVRAVKNLFGLEAEIKEPNDVLISLKKVCGILTEKTKDALIIGIGINVNTKEFPKGLAATSLALESGKKADKEKVFQEVLKCLDNEYLKFLGSEL